MDFVRAIRRGVRRDGRSLIVMPSEVFTHLSQEDLGAVIAFLKQVTPVDREVPRSGFGPVGRALLAAGKMNILVAGKTPHITPPVSVPADTTAAYGKYIADIAAVMAVTATVCLVGACRSTRIAAGVEPDASRYRKLDRGGPDAGDARG
jgi:hypothetical protein